LSLSSEQIEQRRNIFWVGLVVERQMAIRMGRPSVIHDDDIGVDLPKATGPPGANFGHLRYVSQIVLIDGKIYNNLYSAKAISRSRIDRLRSAGLLDEELEYWRDQLPREIRPGCEVQLSEDKYLPTMMMHFAYFHSLTMIHRASSMNSGPWTEKHKLDDSTIKALKDSNINPRVFSGGAICIDAARSAISLLEQVSNAINMIDLNMFRYIFDLSFLSLFQNSVSVNRLP
jgi:hypothetical protein